MVKGSSWFLVVWDGSVLQWGWSWVPGSHGVNAGDHHSSASWCHPWWDLILGQLGWDIKSRVSAEAGAGEGVFLGEKANLEFLDLIRKQLRCVQGGVAWGRTEPLGHGPALQKKAWRGAGESDLAKTQNSMRQPRVAQTPVPFPSLL